MKTILVALFCVLLSFFVLITDSHFTNNLLENNDAKGPTKQLLKHFFFLAPMPQVFDAQEQSHLNDVAALIRIAFAVFAIICGLLLYLRPNANNIYYGAGLLAAALFLLALLPFDKLFTSFHQVFFPQGNWQFSIESTLIQFYPFEFFMKYAAFIALYSLLIALFLCAFAFFSTRNKQ